MGNSKILLFLFNILLLLLLLLGSQIYDDRVTLGDTCMLIERSILTWKIWANFLW